MHRKWITRSVVAAVLSVSACSSDEAVTTSPLSARTVANASIVSVAHGRIVFTSDRDGNSQIYTMNADGSGQANLTNNSTQEIFPAWSPDGRKVAFTSSRDGNYEIYVMNADGTGQVRLTNSVGTDWFAKWSPDGTKIVFASGRTGAYEIFVMNADGTNQTQLTSSFSWDYGPAWSPDGTRIVFSSQRDGGGPAEIYVMKADGTAQTRLTNNSASDVYPAWSPHGTKIAFTSYRDGNAEIYVMNADGSSQTRLTNSTGSDVLPAWSPEGSMIAFDSDRNGTPEIYAMKADGTAQARLTNNAAFDYGSDWGRVPPPPSVANYVYSCTGLACTFDGRISSGATGYHWDFGDGATGGVALHPRTYASPGTYTVTLTTAPSGAQSVMAKTIVVPTPPPVGNPPVAKFTWSCAGLTCTFDASTATDDGFITQYKWDLGRFPNPTASGVIVGTTYAHSGSRTVVLTVTDNSGMTGTITTTFVLP